MINELFELMQKQTLMQDNTIIGLPTEKALIVSLCYTLVIAGLMALTYRLSYSAISYNRKFNIAIVMMACVSTVLLTLVQTNPLFSLGVLGSLSICRIRMNTKDPRDLGFVFWALSIGIASAEGAFLAGAICAVILSVLLIFSSRVVKGSGTELLIVTGDNSELERARKTIHAVRGVSLQSENIFEDSFEFVYSVNVKGDEEQQLVEKLKSYEGIKGVNILVPETQVA